MDSTTFTIFTLILAVSLPIGIFGIRYFFDKPIGKKLSAPKKVLTQEEKLSKEIDAILESGEEIVKKLAPTYSKRVDAFLSEYPTKSEAEDYRKTYEELEVDHVKISELLLRVLISFDNLEIPSEMTEIRNQRRAGIKRLQSIINSADSDWSRVKKAHE